MVAGRDARGVGLAGLGQPGAPIPLATSIFTHFHSPSPSLLPCEGFRTGEICWLDSAKTLSRSRPPPLKPGLILSKGPPTNPHTLTFLIPHEPRTQGWSVEQKHRVPPRGDAFPTDDRLFGALNAAATASNFRVPRVDSAMTADRAVVVRERSAHRGGGLGDGPSARENSRAVL